MCTYLRRMQSMVSAVNLWFRHEGLKNSCNIIIFHFVHFGIAQTNVVRPTNTIFFSYLFLTDLAICGHWNDSNRAQWNLCRHPMWSSSMEIRIQNWPIWLLGTFCKTNLKRNVVTMCAFCFLSFSICRRLGVKSGGAAATVYHKTNRETMVEIGDSIRGKDIYIIQTGTKYGLIATGTCGVMWFQFQSLLCILSPVYLFFSQRCQQQHYGTIDYGVCMQNIFGTFNCWRHTVFAVLETMQNA